MRQFENEAYREEKYSLEMVFYGKKTFLKITKK